MNQPYWYPGGTVVVPTAGDPFFWSRDRLAIWAWCRARDIHVASVIPVRTGGEFNLHVCIGSGQEHIIEFALSWLGGNPHRE